MLLCKIIISIVLSLCVFTNQSFCIDLLTNSSNEETNTTLSNEEILTSVVTFPTTLVTSLDLLDKNGSSTIENINEPELTSRSLSTDDLVSVSTISPNTSRDLFNKSRNLVISNDYISTTIAPASKKNVSDVLKKWQHFENITKIFAKKTVKNLLPGLMEGTGDMNISASCSRDILKLLIGLQNIKTWAFSCKYAFLIF